MILQNNSITINKHLIYLSIFSLIMTYLTYHALMSPNGLLEYISLSRNTEILTQESEEIKAKLLKLESKVTRLRNESLDIELLDEVARKNLGYVNKNEKIFTIE